MTQGDIHNRKQTYQRIQQKILTSPKITDRDKDILINGTETVPSFLSYLETQNMSTSRINRYLRTWKRISEHTDWEIEQADKTKIADLIGDIHKDRLKKKNGEPEAEFAPDLTAAIGLREPEIGAPDEDFVATGLEARPVFIEEDEEDIFNDNEPIL